MSGSLLNERFIAVNPSLIRAIGLTEAVVVQEIHFASCEDYIGGEAGQVTMGQNEIADRTGLTRNVVHRSLKKLLADQLIYIEAETPRSKKSYRVNHDNIEAACAKPRKKRASAKPRKDMRETAQDGADMQSYKEESLKNPSGVPEDQPPLDGFDQPDPAAAPSEYDPAFERIWKTYPRGGKGPNGESIGKRGDKAESEKAYLALVRKGFKPDEIAARVRNYAEAREIAEQVHGGPAPVMGGPKFFSAIHKNWSAAVTSEADERVERWEFACKKHRAEQPTAGTASDGGMSAEVAAQKMLATFRKHAGDGSPQTVWNNLRATLEAESETLRAVVELAGWPTFQGSERDALFTLRAAWKQHHEQLVSA